MDHIVRVIEDFISRIYIIILYSHLSLFMTRLRSGSTSLDLKMEE